jgi:hypothetical protein
MKSEQINPAFYLEAKFDFAKSLTRFITGHFYQVESSNDEHIYVRHLDSVVAFTPQEVDKHFVRHDASVVHRLANGGHLHSLASRVIESIHDRLQIPCDFKRFVPAVDHVHAGLQSLFIASRVARQGRSLKGFEATLIDRGTPISFIREALTQHLQAGGFPAFDFGDYTFSFKFDGEESFIITEAVIKERRFGIR